MRKNWFLSRNKEEAILDLTQRYDNQPPKVRKIFLRRKNLEPRSFLYEIIGSILMEIETKRRAAFKYVVERRG
jgi:hypothetical protein